MRIRRNVINGWTGYYIYIACSEKNHVFLALCVLVFDHSQWSPTEASLSYGTAGGLTMELVMKWHSWGYSLHWERSSLSYRLKMENMEKSIHIMFPCEMAIVGIHQYTMAHGIPWYTIMVYHGIPHGIRHIHFLMIPNSKIRPDAFWIFLRTGVLARADAADAVLIVPLSVHKDSWIGSE